MRCVWIEWWANEMEDKVRGMVGKRVAYRAEEQESQGLRRAMGDERQMPDR